MEQQENNDCLNSVCKKNCLTEVEKISIHKAMGSIIGLFIALLLYHDISSEIPYLFASRYLPCIVIGYMAGNTVCAIGFLCKKTKSELKK